MPEFTLKDFEVAKDMPGYSGGPAKVLLLTLEDDKGETRQAELFTMASTPLPSIGDKLEGEIQSSDYGPKFKKGGGGQRRGGGGKSPQEKKEMNRLSCQKQALQREANMIAHGHRPYTGDQLRSVINWFEEDIKGKDRAIIWDGYSDDVPADETDLPNTPIDIP